MLHRHSRCQNRDACLDEEVDDSVQGGGQVQGHWLLWHSALSFQGGMNEHN